LDFCGEELLASCPTHFLKDPPLSAVSNILFNIPVFVRAVLNWTTSLPPGPENVPCRDDRIRSCIMGKVA
jgi:hypothetical protein